MGEKMNVAAAAFGAAYVASRAQAKAEVAAMEQYADLALAQQEQAEYEARVAREEQAEQARHRASVEDFYATPLGQQWVEVSRTGRAKLQQLRGVERQWREAWGRAAQRVLTPLEAGDPAPVRNERREELALLVGLALNAIAVFWVAGEVLFWVGNHSWLTGEMTRGDRSATMMVVAALVCVTVVVGGVQLEKRRYSSFVDATRRWHERRRAAIVAELGFNPAEYLSSGSPMPLSWSSSEPQPRIAALIDMVESDVLDRTWTDLEQLRALSEPVPLAVHVPASLPIEVAAVYRGLTGSPESAGTPAVG